ncbi:helix-turn-helix domain-containing protein [Aquibacillus albus]|uniref:Excisionase family DNA binding protein n=1 Tax=Aquibacillus albus TaxID=1168171 RepID=A0ABS2N625_9BACI|nr:excisionase family DNA binding protein [Aquibacillus albus]
MNQNADVLTIAQVANYLQISEVTTYKLVKEGKIPAFKVARQWRVKKEDLSQFIEKQKLDNFS